MMGCTLLAVENDSGSATPFPAQTAWTLALNNRLAGAPAYGDSQMYFPIEGDRLVAYDLSGRQLWIVHATQRSRLAAGNNLVFSVDTAGITARSAADGSERWTVPLDEPLAAALTWDNGWLIAGTVSGSLLALRAEDGQLIWRANLPAPLHAPAALSGKHVYVPTADAHVRALQLDTGEEAWKFRLGDAPNEILALDTRIYVGSNDKYFYCLDAETGERLFRWPTGADVIGQPVIIGRRVYFVSLDNFLYALDARSGSQAWAVRLPGRPIRGAIRAGEAVLVTGLGSKIHGYGARDGKLLGELALPHPIVAAPTFLTDPTLLAPVVVVVSHELEKGATVTAFSRSTEPPSLPLANITDAIAKTLGVKPTTP
jgi:outer membrane protein assembly factor BamB